MGWFPKRLSEEALKLRARNEYNSKDYSNAEKTLLKLKKVAKNQTWANDVLARLYMNTERHEKAIPLWNQICQSSDNPHRELQYLIECYQVTKRFEEAILILNSLELSEDVYNQKIDTLRKMGEYKEASQYFDLGYKQFPNSKKILISGIRLTWDVGDMDSVQTLSSIILQQNPKDDFAVKFNLQSLVKLGNFSELRRSVESVLKSNPNNIDAHNIALNLAFDEDGDYEEAIRICDKILQFEPSFRQALTKKILALGKLGRNNEMIDASELAQSILSDDDEVTLAYAQAQWQVNPGKHIDLVNSMLERHGMAKISSNAKNKSLAIEYIECETESLSSHDEMVSVIMTVYGKDKYLDVAINSILNQTHTNLELIIVDDRSQDDAWEYLQNISKRDSRIKLLQVDKNGGTYLAKNLGLTEANGDYIAFMDSDDWTHPQRIERQIYTLKSKSDSKAVWHKYFRIDESGNVIFRGKGAIRSARISLLCKKEVIDQIGFFDSLRVGADTEFVERIQAYFGKNALIEDPTPSMFMLQHSSSLTGGGKFQISWRSITDYRLAHHSSFREWHRKISAGRESPYVPRILRVRPFNVPEEMLAGDDLCP